MKKIAVAVLICLLILQMSCFAYSYPSEVWKWNDGYTKALEQGDDEGIITNGLEIVRIMESAPEGPENTNMIRTRLMEVGKAYAGQGNFDASAQIFQNYLNHSGEDDFDGQRVARAKAMQYQTHIRIFTEGGETWNAHQKNEHKNGVV